MDELLHCDPAHPADFSTFAERHEFLPTYCQSSP